MGGVTYRLLGKVYSLLGLFAVLHLSVNVVVFCFFVKITVGLWSSKKSREIISNYGQRYWVEVIASIFPPTKFVVSGDVPDGKAPGIIIANHQTDADFWYVWECCRALGRAGDVKIILKEDVGDIPVIGWGIRLFEFILLARNWASDQDRMRRRLAAFGRARFPLLLLIFPEGTTANTETRDKCHAFAARTGRPRLERLLLPRTTGFSCCLQNLPDDAEGYNIYDMTIAYSSYSGEVPTWSMGYTRKHDLDIPSVARLMHYDPGKEVHIHITKTSAPSIVANVDKWMDETWVRKERRLGNFAARGRLYSAATEEESEAPAGTGTGAGAGASAKEEGRRGHGRPAEYRSKIRRNLHSIVLVPSLLPVYILQVFINWTRPSSLPNFPAHSKKGSVLIKGQEGARNGNKEKAQ